MSAKHGGKLISGVGIAAIDNRGIAAVDIADIKIVRTDMSVIDSRLSRESPESWGTDFACGPSSLEFDRAFAASPGHHGMVFQNYSPDKLVNRDSVVATDR